ncbi:transporter [Methylorubrum rhodesianum]|uniref:SphA family protein n=1 Tax=Methylorubrum TaxID=2282523 RepID=UPI0016188AF3|nr:MULTISPECIES: transporter [Methylorubrum]MBB5764409.1 hypothetical protein [Methylorubrum rhodesianum]MBI1689602.1 transporter [Methylorubrum sp. DB1722]
MPTLERSGATSGRSLRAAGVLALAAAVCISPPFEREIEAAEAATGVYLLGIRGPLAGVTPPPGFYFENDFYHYSGALGGGRAFQSGGVVAANVRQDSNINLVTPLWVTPVEIFGGNLGFSVAIPFGEPTVTAGALLYSPRIDRLVGGRVSDSTFNAGDPFVSAFVGWHSGNFHWSLNLSGNIPAGAYEVGQLSNVALNRPAIDLTGALTYLDPVAGYEVSVIPGVTFNFENPATRYISGNEFHVEWSATKFLTKEFTLGFVGFHYQQFTDDGGPGNRIGPFRGRVTALGGMLGYDFKVGQTPVTTRVKVLRDVEVQNRFAGTTLFVSVAFPLWVAPPKTAPEPRPLVAKN